MKNKTSVFQPHLFSSTYGYILVVAGIWAYFDTGDKAQFITVILGVVLLIMNNGVQYGTKEAKYVAICTTGLSLYVVFRPLAKYFSDQDMISAARTVLMLLVGTSSLILIGYDIFFAKKVKIRQQQKNRIDSR